MAFGDDTERTAGEVPTTGRADMPLSAACKGCGYLLRDLGNNVCPECGRAFDPADAATYVANPTVDRWRRRLVRLSVAVAVILIALAFCPRGFRRGILTVTCPDCGHQTIVRRWEIRAPIWLAVRYPGHSSTSVLQTDQVVGEYGQLIAPSIEDGGPGTVRTLCENHYYSATVRIASVGGGSMIGSAGHVPVFNGMEVWPETAEAVLKTMMAPTARGFVISSAAVPDPPSDHDHSVRATPKADK